MSIADEDTGTPSHGLPGVPEIGATMLDKYRIVGAVGRGGMGVVMEAWHLQLDERVAIKFLLPELGANEEAIARFEREARMLFKIKSEHVCRVLDVGKLAAARAQPPIPYMVMEYLEGQDLASVLMQRRGLPVDVAVSWGLQACQALAEAHSRGIVHRDLKPENLFLSERRDGSGCIKLLDFGLSKLLATEAKDKPRQRKLTSYQRVMGTPNYMSPEQWMSARDVGPAADQWALAIIIYELIAGVVPFDAEQMPQICSKVLHEPTPSLCDVRGDVPPGLDAVIRHALEKKPDKRHANIGMFALALARFGDRGAMPDAERSLSMLTHAPERSGQIPVFRSSLTSTPEAPSDMETTVREPPSIDPAALAAAKEAMSGGPAAPGARAAAAPRRAVTAQSWQQMLVDAPRQRSRVAIAAALGVVALLALLVGAVALTASDGDDTSAGTAEAAAKPTASAAVDAEPREADEPEPAETAAPMASAAVSASARAASAQAASTQGTSAEGTSAEGTSAEGTSAEAPPPVRPAAKPTRVARPAARRAPAKQQEPPPKKKRSIFDGR